MRATAFLLFLLLLPAQGGWAEDRSYMPNTDVPGQDLIHAGRDFIYLPKPRPRLCQAYCLSVKECQAWTYLRPPALGPLATCWLKSSQTGTQSDKCCVSGIR